MKTTRLLFVTFNNKIYENEIPFFRGAIIDNFGNNTNSLFHNHLEDKFRYSYPLIQYKHINNRPMLLGINEGADAIDQLNLCNNFTCQLGYRKVTLSIGCILSEQVTVSLSDTLQRYRIQRWLPLNSENYQEYQTNESLIDRIQMLEKILTGNILSFAKGIGLYLEQPVLCKLIKLEDTGTIPYKGVELMSFNADFQTNMNLPEFIGIGKAASINCGTITHI